MATETASQALCLSCGACCDGTLFGYVQLKAADTLLPLQAGGIAIEANHSGQYFNQPCAAFQGGRCQVYTGRPSRCQAYRCELLKEYEGGARSLAEAQQIVDRVQTLKKRIATEIERVAPEGNRMTIGAVVARVPTRKQLSADPDLWKTWAPVMLLLAALLDSVKKHFKPPRKEHVLDAGDTAHVSGNP